MCVQLENEVHVLWARISNLCVGAQARTRRACDRMYPELRSNPGQFKEYCRMLPPTFDYVVEAIKPVVERATTNFRKPISVEERLMVTLRYLATGIQFRQLAFSFRISRSSISQIVKEVCKAIWTALVVKHMPEPSEENFRSIAQGFWDRWQFPNCIGCIDGTHKRKL